MGSDRAPTVEVEGSVAACAHLGDNDTIVLVGNRPAIQKALARQKRPQDKIEIVHANQRIGMNESPVESLRAKPNSSIAVLAQLHAEGAIDGCISAGNSGAFVSATQMRLRRLRGVHRPGVAIMIPTLHGPVILCDGGANMSCRPRHLYQYAIMASIYMETVYGVKNPRVGLLSVGEEDEKGTDLVRAANGLIKRDSSIYFIGNVESRDLFNGACDVMVCDGFVGNVVIKLIEGMSGGLIRDILNNLKDLTTSTPELRQIAMWAASQTLETYDFNQHGGAPVLGVGGIVILCHGANSCLGMTNAVLLAHKYARHKVNQRITERLTQNERAGNGR